jgi:hypothetical protein
MKNQTGSANSIVSQIFSFGATRLTPTKKESTTETKVTLRIEDGILHINNLTGRTEGIIYSLMAEDGNGATKLMTRYVSLAPFQVHADEFDGARVLAAWEKN